MKILAINPGSTSTKIAVYEDERPVLVRTIRHRVDELARFPRVIDQFEFRKGLVAATLQEEGVPLRFDAVIGRGGLLKPIAGGVYEVNDAMLDDLMHALHQHACNLGCLIAHELALAMPGCRAFMADPGVVDELDDVARLTGSPLLPRITIWHALNQRAIARRFARELSAREGRTVAYEDLNLIIIHLGGGISIGAHRRGRCVDVNNALDGEGPFSPERAGTLPAGALVDLCYSRRFTQAELKRRISGHAGLAAHLGTTDVQEVVRRITEEGDEHARLVLDAMIYQVAKSVGGAAVALRGEVDATLVTGGIAHSAYVVERLKERVQFLAPVHVYPGEDELQALALNALGVLRGELRAQQYR